MSEATVKSARRVFEVLELFDRIRAPLSLKDVCERLGYPPSSGAAILKSLVMLGYLEYDKRSRTYLPTMRIAALGSWVVTDLFGGLNIIELMERLGTEIGLPVILATQSDLHCQYAHVLNPLDTGTSLTFDVAPGTLRPLAKSGLGRLLLSCRTDRSIQSIVRRIDAARQPGEDKIDVDELMKSVNKIRRDGYVTSHGLVTQGVGIMGVLLPENPFRRVFAIGLGGSSEELEKDRERHLLLLRKAVSDFAKILN